MKQLIMMDEQEFRAQVQSIVLKEISRSTNILTDMIVGKMDDLRNELQHKPKSTITMVPDGTSRQGYPWQYPEDLVLQQEFARFLEEQANNHGRSITAIACRIKKHLTNCGV